MWTKGLSTTRKDSANNKSNYSEKGLPNLDSRSRRFRLERVFGEGMSRKKFCLDRSRDLFLEIQPTFHRPRWGRFCLLILISFSATGDDAIEFVRAASQQWLSVSTMVLSEAR